jgi:glyoxylase-like metal-dependent hydrolase (beta-lactamase superfamily II)
MRHLANMLLISVAALSACQSVAKPTKLRFVPWINGVSAAEPALQVQQFDADTFVLRQSMRTNPEGPFLYLLFGKDRAFLVDTGAGGTPIRPTVEKVISDWCNRHHRSSIPLVVAHSHGHGDHIAGDAEFEGRLQTSIVGHSPAQVASYFGFTNWPNELRSFDLGGRNLTIIPTPGHQPAHIAIFDPRAQLLMSGDMLYPGRLYVPSNRFSEYRNSVAMLASFTRDHPVSLILGAHIEMTTTPGQDFPLGSSAHPNEHMLELGPESLMDLQTAVQGMGDDVRRQVTGSFIVFPMGPRAPDPSGFEPPSAPKQ